MQKSGKKQSYTAGDRARIVGLTQNRGLYLGSDISLSGYNRVGNKNKQLHSPATDYEGQVVVIDKVGLVSCVFCFFDNKARSYVHGTSAHLLLKHSLAWYTRARVRVSSFCCCSHQVVSGGLFYAAHLELRPSEQMCLLPDVRYNYYYYYYYSYSSYYFFRNCSYV